MHGRRLYVPQLKAPDPMTNELREYLATIEPLDTSETLARLRAIREEARAEAEAEARRILEQDRPKVQEEGGDDLL
jgi:hypothetical protein